MTLLKSLATRLYTQRSHTPGSFSIYIHWPYCESKCTYCNFNKYVNPQHPPHDRLINAYKSELQYYFSNEAKYKLKKRKVHSVYFGGGTPSLMKPSGVRAILETIDQRLGLNNDMEVTLEANPTSIESFKLRDFKRAGINRVSLGIQSLITEDLRLLGRDHSGQESIKALLLAKEIFGEKRVTFDMIYGRPGQTAKGWVQELKQALELAGDHVSIYQLTVERSTPLHKQSLKKQLPHIPDVDTAADMYEKTVQIMKDYGYTQYEVSNYAKHQEAISRHNFSYWQGMDYLGIGPGAHGRLADFELKQKVRTFGEFHPNKYINLCEQEGEGLRKIEPVPLTILAEEMIMFGLRTRMGIPRTRFTDTTGMVLDNFLDRDALKMFIDLKLLVDEATIMDKKIHNYTPKELIQEWNTSGGIRPTDAGLEKIDYILPRILKTREG
ncbi:hypothetical protein BDF20DRAFT_851312 [Mycotypha africana]|uniref:uncharacterized protein n=1 Tax=Mycotypha africana TaxID=64632 RepID=UPI00230129C8|nr:uncharacterized protein BDF20DRAFT_851312 [Mycotypha africana]KAI8987631.1 hypothetical protein BDF20DRAFT_851312 [Mycotypha africana]